MIMTISVANPFSSVASRIQLQLDTIVQLHLHFWEDPMRTIGVDVSHWEGIIDWREASKWVPFAYFKCTDGQSMFDNTFVINRSGCRAAGMPWAPFHYWQSTHDPEEQAVYFVSKVGDHTGRYIVASRANPIQRPAARPLP
jgi:GH25 family lysozyme M1 (1,4-beta-N-acetylmuramidase)